MKSNKQEKPVFKGMEYVLGRDEEGRWCMKVLYDGIITTRVYAANTTDLYHMISVLDSSGFNMPEAV